MSRATHGGLWIIALATLFFSLAAGPSMQQAFSDALKADDLPAMERALQAGADVNAVDEFGRTALHEAAKNKSRQVVTFLLDHGASINAADAEGRTPLHLAHSDAIDVLLARHADAKAVDHQGNTALHTAAEGETARACYRLVDAGVPVDVTNNAGLTPLHFAAMQGHREPAALLCSRGANVNAKTTADYTYKWTYVAPGVLGMEQTVPAGSTPLSIAMAQHAKNKWVDSKYQTLTDFFKLQGATPPPARFNPLRYAWLVTTPLFLLVFGWGICHLDAKMRGWSALANRYAATAPAAGKVDHHQDGGVGTIGLIKLRSMLTASASDAGLYLAMPTWLSAGHPPLLLPWDQLKVSRTTTLFGQTVVDLNVVSSGSIILRGGVADEVLIRLQPH